MLTMKKHAAIKATFIGLLRSTKRPGIEDLINYLETTDFYHAPARTVHGCAYPGGLLVHSMHVYQLLREKLSPGSNPVWNCVTTNPEITPETIVIVALLHDMYKIGLYQPAQRNEKSYDEADINAANPYSVKRDDTGTWVWKSVQGYRKEDRLPLGSGEKSVMLAQQFIRLTMQEMFAIRWHRSSVDDRAHMSAQVMREYPLTLALYEADMEATYLLEDEPTTTQKGAPPVAG